MTQVSKGLTLLSLIAFLGAIGCGGSDPEPINCEIVGPTIVVDEVVAADCGVSNGGFTISVSGTSEIATFSLGGGTFLESGTFDGLEAGVYDAFARFDNGCENAIRVTVGNNSDLSLTNLTTSDAGCGEDMGTISVNATGGDGTYSFSINNGAFQDQGSFSGLDAGLSIITVRDGIGCEFSTTVNLQSGISYANEVRDIIISSCAISGCHNGSNSLPNYNNFSEVTARVEDIKTRTGNRSMPPSSTGIRLSNEEIQSIACWVDDGGPNN
ncbi:MAG: SprB repeat-containing protein [Bacteroidota bacterium]